MSLIEDKHYGIAKQHRKDEGIELEELLPERLGVGLGEVSLKSDDQRIEARNLERSEEHTSELQSH